MNNTTWHLKCLTFILCGVFLSATASAMAASPSNTTPVENTKTDDTALQADVALLAEILAKTHAMQARFTHVMRDIDGEVVDESSGLMAWLKPDKFRWDIKQPVEQSIVVDGDTYYQLDNDLDQLIIETVTPEITALTSILLGGDAKTIATDFKVQQIIAMAGAGQSRIAVDPVTKFKLVPLGENAAFISATLEFNGEFLQLLAIEDDLNNISLFEFFVHNFTGTVNDATFEIQTSETTEIIRQ